MTKKKKKWPIETEMGGCFRSFVPRPVSKAEALQVSSQHGAPGASLSRQQRIRRATVETEALAAHVAVVELFSHV